MGLEELFDELRTLPPADLERVIDFVAHLRRRQRDERLPLEEDGEAVLDRIAANPELKARFNAMLERVTESCERGDVYDSETIFAELREKSRRAQGLE